MTVFSWGCCLVAEQLARVQGTAHHLQHHHDQAVKEKGACTLPHCVG
jgi:hypothetical protein